MPTTYASCGVSRRSLDKHRGINDGATTVLQGEGGVSLAAIVAWGLGYSASWDMLAAGAVGCPVSYALARRASGERGGQSPLLPLTARLRGVALCGV